jgi:hypothetical protein
MSEQDTSLSEMLRRMQTNADNMSIMAREICRALEIDVPSLFDTLYDQDSSPHATSHIVSEVDRGSDHSQDSIEGDAPQVR